MILNNCFKVSPKEELLTLKSMLQGLLSTFSLIKGPEDLEEYDMWVLYAFFCVCGGGVCDHHLHYYRS